MSFAVSPNGSSPAKSTRIVLGSACGSVCVASTCSTSDVPMPKASAPNAPCVDVWLSPQTIVIPGCVSPSSGPITWTIPSRPLPVAKSRTPNSSQFARKRVELRARERVGDRARRASGRCGPSSRPSGRDAAPAGRRRAATRTPAGSSPRARGAGRRRGATARRPPRRRRARPRSCGRASRLTVALRRRRSRRAAARASAPRSSRKRRADARGRSTWPSSTTSKR